MIRLFERLDESMGEEKVNWSYYSAYEEPFYRFDVSTTWLDWSLGPSWSYERFPDFNDRKMWRGYWQLSFQLGPWSVSLLREWKESRLA